MAKKLSLLAAVIVVALIVAVVGIALLYPAMQPQSAQSQAQDAYKILQSSKNAVENLESMAADAYFSQSISNGTFTEQSEYSMTLEFLQQEGTKINFKNYEYKCSSEESEVVHERLSQSLKNAWIIDTNDKFYVYSPMLLKEYVTEFTPQSSLQRYDFIPVVDSLHIASLFDSAEDATYEGIETINVGNTPVEAYVVSYKFRDPTIKFMDKADLRTWISTADYIPLKTELNATSGETKINFEFGFNSYEKNVFIPPANLSPPKNLKVIPR